MSLWVRRSLEQGNGEGLNRGRGSQNTAHPEGNEHCWEPQSSHWVQILRPGNPREEDTRKKVLFKSPHEGTSPSCQPSAPISQTTLGCQPGCCGDICRLRGRRRKAGDRVGSGGLLREPDPQTQGEPGSRSSRNIQTKEKTK